MPIPSCGPSRPSSSPVSFLDEVPFPASPSEWAPARARVADPNEWPFANQTFPHSPLLATERHAELKGVYEGFKTDKPTTRQLHIEGRVAAERHRQMEVDGQTGDARAALAAVKLEREKRQKELGRLDLMFSGRSGHSQLQQPNPNQSDLHGVWSIFHSLRRSALGKVAIAPRALTSLFSSRRSICVHSQKMPTLQVQIIVSRTQM
jgi:hypothetical protein